MEKKIILTGLCFWSTEAIFQRIKGVSFTQCGYYNIENFDFAWQKEDLLESVLIHYNEDEISLSSILDLYLLTHNPALISWNIEECIYPLCRPAIFYFNESDLLVINNKCDLFKENTNEPFYTKTLQGDLSLFRKASEYDQNFYNKKPSDGFSCANIAPKLEKVKNKYPDLLK